MKRYYILDEIRGITLCSMILYHAVWDLVYIFGRNFAWYRSDFAYIWQQSICWCFILLSGFCFSLGRKKMQRWLIVLGAGTIVSVVTHFVMPGQSIRFGVLTMLGSSMLLLGIYEKIMKIIANRETIEYKYPIAGLVISFLFFIITRGINLHYLGFEGIRLMRLPNYLYEKGDLMTYIGFTDKDFYSTDYFSVLPWFFLFLSGYFLFHLMRKKDCLNKMEKIPSLGKNLRFLGKYSLIIYLLHQPIIYAVLLIVNKI